MFWFEAPARDLAIFAPSHFLRCRGEKVSLARGDTTGDKSVSASNVRAHATLPLLIDWTGKTTHYCWDPGERVKACSSECCAESACWVISQLYHSSLVYPLYLRLDRTTRDSDIYQWGSARSRSFRQYCTAPHSWSLHCAPPACALLNTG